MLLAEQRKNAHHAACPIFAVSNRPVHLYARQRVIFFALISLLCLKGQLTAISWLRAGFRFKSYDIDQLPRKQSLYGGAWGMRREWPTRRILWRQQGQVYDTVRCACPVL